MHGSYSVTRGQIIRVGVPKGPKYFRSMMEGELDDRNNIFLPMYYALFFLGTSNIIKPKIVSIRLIIIGPPWYLLLTYSVQIQMVS